MLSSGDGETLKVISVKATKVPKEPQINLLKSYPVTFLTTTQLNAVEFKGKFIQGHYIVGVTAPSSK